MKTVAFVALLALSADYCTDWCGPGVWDGNVCVLTTGANVMADPEIIFEYGEGPSCVGRATKRYRLCTKDSPLRSDSPLQKAEDMRT